MPQDLHRCIHRVAVYFAPPAANVLSIAGAHWLGRDAQTGAACAQPDLPSIAAITEDARLYGFHATLKPPMRLAEGCTWDDVRAAAHALATRVAPFDLPRLAVMDTFGFLALRETSPCPALQALSDLCVTELDDLRAPPSAAELARRRKSSLTVAQNALLERWGYPYVFGAWFFHMTLTRRLDAAEYAFWQRAAESFFAEALRTPQRVSDLCLFTQLEPHAAFTIAERIPLRG